MKENFKCGICEKYFSSNEYKSLHILNVHGEEKRFICNICNSNFKTKVILKKHIKGIHQAHQRNYKCDSCEKTYIRSGQDSRWTKKFQMCFL